MPNPVHGFACGRTETIVPAINPFGNGFWDVRNHIVYYCTILVDGNIGFSFYYLKLSSY